jgi:hypothetical protein
VGALPPTILLAPLDISSHLLVFTHHKVIATGHHRALQGMKTVISAFTSAPEQSRPIVQASPATYLAYCSGENELGKYAKLFPASLTAALLKGRAPSWLQPVPMRPGESIRVYRILRPGQGAPRP